MRALKIRLTDFRNIKEAEISFSPRELLASKSNFTPTASTRERIASLTSLAFSPIPAVNTIASKPPIKTKYDPI